MNSLLRAQGLNGTEILDILNYKPTEAKPKTITDGNDANVTDAGNPTSRSCVVNLGLKASNKSPIKVIDNDEEESEVTSDEARDGYQFSDSDEYERAKQISAITIMEDKTEEEKNALIDEVDERFAEKKRGKRIKEE